MVSLQIIDENNYRECLSLTATVINENFVDQVAWSLAEAWVLGSKARPFAIFADEQMVGYVLMYVPENHYQIINFLIDDRFQNKGYGTKAAEQCVTYLRNEYGAKQISLPVDLQNDKAQRLWRNIGFEMSETIEDGYCYMRINFE